MSCAQLTRLIGLGATAVLVLLVARPYLQSEPSRPGPKTLQEAIALSRQKGLSWGTDEYNGRPQTRIVISELPVTVARCQRLYLGSDRPTWAATVAVYADWRRLISCYDPERSAIWGELFVYGDPLLIEKLIGNGH